MKNLKQQSRLIDWYARILFIFLVLFFNYAHADSRLIATGGATQLEGSAGGGIVPWAVITGYGTKDEIGATAFWTDVNVQDFSLDSKGVAVGIYNRVELSFARHKFNLESLGGVDLEQNVIGGKVRLWGDIIYTTMPQISAGFQYKHNDTFTIPNAAGARDDHGLDLYLAASKLWLGGFFNYNLLTNVTLRGSKANQLGLLGFGGDKGDDYEVVFEGSVAVLLNRRLAVGYDYRQKPDNLSFAKEDDWQDVFIAWFPNKHFAAVAAYADLGSIAGFKSQHGLYLSIQASF